MCGCERGNPHPPRRPFPHPTRSQPREELHLAAAAVAALLISRSRTSRRPYLTRRMAVVLVVVVALVGAALTLEIGGFTVPPAFG